MQSVDVEIHEREQYFFDQPTVSAPANVAAGFENPCCLCAPLVAEELARRGRNVRTLDIDERFAHLPGFRRYDLQRPTWVSERFDLIICDPPFFGVSLARLFRAMRQLAHFDTSTPLMIAYLQRRQTAVLRRFQSFQLQPTGLHAGYRTVETTGKNVIEFVASRSLQPAIAGSTAGH